MLTKNRGFMKSQEIELETEIETELETELETVSSYEIRSLIRNKSNL